MSLRDYIIGIRNYFSRAQSQDIPLEEGRGRNAQVGYKERENWFDKTLSVSGAVLKYVGLGAVALTGVGAVALGVQYLRNSFPFRAVKEPEYVITRNKINEKPARPLEPGVNVYVPPFVRIVEENNRPVTVTARQQSTETGDFMYRSSEGALVKLNLEYKFQVATPEGAAKVYWDFGGLNRASETLDTIVENVLMNEVALVSARDIANEERIAIAGEHILSDKSYKIAKGGERINYLIQAEHRVNRILRQEGFGIVVTNFAFSNPRFTDDVEAAWVAPIKAEQERIAEVDRARQRVIKEEGEAQARIIKARSEAQEAEIQASVTLATAPMYAQSGTILADAERTTPGAGHFALQQQQGDNAQQSGARFVYIPFNPLSGQNSPHITIQNLGKAETKSPRE